MDLVVEAILADEDRARMLKIFVVESQSERRLILNQEQDGVP
jgi:hypothetical protein